MQGGARGGGAGRWRGDTSANSRRRLPFVPFPEIRSDGTFLSKQIWYLAFVLRERLVQWFASFPYSRKGSHE